MIASFYNAETEKHISDAEIEVVPRVGDRVNGIWIVIQVEHAIVMGIGEASGHAIVVHMMRLP